MKNNEITKRPDMGIFDKQFPVRLVDAPICDPTKFTILTGDDGILDDLFSYQVYNKIKNHWRAAAVPADIQPGMIWSDSDDDKLYHHGAADEEILQVTRSIDKSPYFANLYLAEYIYHTGDLDTYVRFQDDQITLRAGGVDFINMVEAATDYLQLLAGQNFINATVDTKMTIGLAINQGANDDEILAFKSEGDVAHGMTDIADTNTYGGFRKITGATGGVALYGLGEVEYGIWLRGMATTDNTVKGAAGIAPIMIDAAKRAGTTIGAMGADANLVIMRNNDQAKWILDEDGDTWQNGNIDLEGDKYIKGTTRLSLLAGASGVCSATIAGDTTVDAENLNIDTDPYMIRHVTSSKKVKDKIKDLELDPALLHKLRTISFNSLCKNDDKAKRYHGLTAEDVEKILPEIIDYDENNEARNYDNRMLVTLMLKEIQEHKIEIEALKAQLNN